MTSLEKQNEIVRLRGLGNSYDSIASITNVSKPTVIKTCSAFSSEIENLQAKNHEHTQSDLMYSIEKRSEMYQDLIKKLYAEIAKRDLTELDTDKLFSVLEKTERALSVIEARVRPKGNNDFDGLSDDKLAIIANAGQNALLKAL